MLAALYAGIVWPIALFIYCQSDSWKLNADGDEVREFKTFRRMPCKLFFPSFSFLIPFINAIQHFYGFQRNAHKNITVTVSVRVSVTVRVSLV